jgi:hypothetical protein
VGHVVLRHVIYILQLQVSSVKTSVFHQGQIDYYSTGGLPEPDMHASARPKHTLKRVSHPKCNIAEQDKSRRVPRLCT